MDGTELTDASEVYSDILNNAQSSLSGSKYSNDVDDMMLIENSVNTNDKQEKFIINENAEKHSAVWTASATLTLLKLYENKLRMLETPKKKTRIWIAIAESLKDYNIEMSPDQVRWKINALTKKYKQCIDNGHHDKFKYFTELNNIYSQYNVICDTYYTISEVMHRKRSSKINILSLSPECANLPESKAMIELRKIRLANKIESDRSQSKLQLEKQWLEYLKRQEEQSLMKDEIFERKLKLRQEELQLRRRELEIRESLELKRLQMKEKEQKEILNMEREKCEMLKKIFSYNS